MSGAAGTGPQTRRNGQDLATQAMAVEANRGQVALSNNDTESNTAGAVGPAVAVSFNTTTGITPKLKGKILILATIFVTNSGVDNESSFQIIRSPAATTGANLGALGGTPIGPIVKATAGHVTADAEASISWVDTGRPVGAAIQYGISAVATAGNDTIPANGAAIVLIELPG